MPLEELLTLSHELGREERQLAIFGEGNTSTSFDDGTFLVKASGASLARLDPAGITQCRPAALLKLLESPGAKDDAVEEALLHSRVDPAAKKPSVEAIFHAWLLTLPNIRYVGHTHPVAVNSILCSRHAPAFARRRLFPDEIVCCGEESVYVPYTDPGLKLARAIRSETMKHIRRFGAPPRVILLGNHGLIAIGPSPAAVLAATMMADKAARIFLGAAAAGPRFLSSAQTRRIAGRKDEHYRRKALNL